MYKIGYFSTSQQITFGKNKAGHTIYKIDVFNEQNSYIVSYGGKLKGKMKISCCQYVDLQTLLYIYFENTILKTNKLVNR